MQVAEVLSRLPTSASCRELPVRLTWVSPAVCPELHEADAIQVASDQVVDAIDSVGAEGLVHAGYGVLVIEACAALEHPTNRGVLTSYARSRGLTTLFAPADAKRVRVRALERRMVSALRLEPATLGCTQA